MKKIILLILIAALLVVSGCGDKTSVNNDAASSDIEASESGSFENLADIFSFGKSAKCTFTDKTTGESVVVYVKDGKQRTEITAEDQKIVSIYSGTVVHTWDETEKKGWSFDTSKMKDYTPVTEEMSEDMYPDKSAFVDAYSNVGMDCDVKVLSNSLFEKPSDVEFQDMEGVPKKESLNFTNVGDFGVKGITAQSNFLQGLQVQQDEYKKIIKQLKSNKQLRTVIEDNDTKQALISAIHALLKELESSK